MLFQLLGICWAVVCVVFVPDDITLLCRFSTCSHVLRFMELNWTFWLRFFFSQTKQYDKIEATKKQVKHNKTGYVLIIKYKINILVNAVTSIN